jgi:hypothetical protein
MRTITTIVCLYLLAVAPVCLQAQEAKSTTVAGFINSGALQDDKINIIITKSLTSYLSKFVKGVTPYTQVEKAASKSFWKQKKLDENDAIGLAQSFGTKQVIAGSYKVNNENETIVVNVMAYDVVTGELRLKRTYKGSSGLDLFDTIDRMVKEVSGLMIGRKLEFGKVLVSASEGTGKYVLYVDGRSTVELTNGRTFPVDSLAGEDSIFSIRLKEDGKELFQKVMNVEANSETVLRYVPSGRVIVKAPEGIYEVFLNGRAAGSTTEKGEMTLEGVTAGTPANIQVRKDNRVIADQTVVLSEGDVKAVYVGGRRDETARVLRFPVQAGMYGLLNNTSIKAGVDWNFLWGFRAIGTGGLVLYSDPATGFGFLPLVEAGLGYTYEFNNLFRAGVSVTALILFGKQVAVMPVANLEVEFWMFILTGGVRYSLIDNGIYPVFSFGVRL